LSSWKPVVVDFLKTHLSRFSDIKNSEESPLQEGRDDVFNSDMLMNTNIQHIDKGIFYDQAGKFNDRVLLKSLI